MQSTPKVNFSHNKYFISGFDFYDQRVLDEIDKRNPEFKKFFKLLALCHTVMPEEKDGEYSFYFCLLDINIVYTLKTHNNVTV